MAEVETRLYPGMFTLDTPLLDERTWRVAKRLVIEHGSDEAAERWLGTPNSDPYFGGSKPSEWFRLKGEGVYLDGTCEVPVMAHRAGIIRTPERPTKVLDDV